MINNTNCFLTKLSAVFFGCYAATVSAASNPASTDYVNSTVIGQAAYGGVVFFTYLSGNVVHGLVAATADEPGGSNYDQQQAIDRCLAKTENGYSDWFLPTNDQISSLFNNRFAINPNDPNGGFQGSSNNDKYWSSTVTNSNYFVQNFYSGLQTTTSAITLYYVRCIRAF